MAGSNFSALRRAFCPRRRGSPCRAPMAIFARVVCAVISIAP